MLHASSSRYSLAAVTYIVSYSFSGGCGHGAEFLSASGTAVDFNVAGGNGPMSGGTTLSAGAMSDTITMLIVEFDRSAS